MLTFSGLLWFNKRSLQHTTPYQEIPARIELEEMDKPCEKCHVVNESVELRHCDELIRELCWEEMSKIKHTEVNHNTAATSSEMNPEAESVSPQSEVEGRNLIPQGEVEDVHFVHSVGDNETNEGYWQDQASYSVAVKNSSSTSEKCRKCDKKILTGVRCSVSMCKTAWHWGCVGIKRDDEKTKTEIMKNSSSACPLCKDADKECSACNVKDKEIHNLKRNIADFERNTEHLNYDLKICNERITDLEDRLNKEKKLRKFIETNLEELKEQEQRRPGCRASSCSISSSSEDSQSSSDESESPSRDNPPLPKRKARRNHTDRSKEKSTSLSVPKLSVEKQKNDEGNSRHSVNKRQPVGRKDSDKNGSERNLPSTLMMSSRPPYDCDTDFGVRNDGSNGCIVRENIQKSSGKSMHSSGTAFSDTNFGDEEYAQMRNYGHCFKFVKFGACTRKFCKFIHVNRNSSYPNHSNFIFGKS